VCSICFEVVQCPEILGFEVIAQGFLKASSRVPQDFLKGSSRLPQEFLKTSSKTKLGFGYMLALQHGTNVARNGVLQYVGDAPPRVPAIAGVANGEFANGEFAIW